MKSGVIGGGRAGSAIFENQAVPLLAAGQRPGAAPSSFAMSGVENDPRKDRSGHAASQSSHASGPGQTASAAEIMAPPHKQHKADTTSTSSSGATSTTERYWKNPINPGTEDVVLIHVCDENRQVSKDFCCKRNILVKHMRYFERFLAENENGYDDIDISVHCDVEIFEWLMSYIHETDKPPVLDKAIVVSILISSEFLQMDTLVDLCLEHIASSLGEIIRLPIDLSCISDKLANKLAMLVSPKTLAQTKDRKDKILNKLYKRRVELDFSRKSAARGGPRTIAASLTCCRYCGRVFLDNWVTSLTCRKSPPAIDYRGNLARRHASIPNWSLTSYLKSLHAGGMGWDAIYWHVWAACEVFAAGDVVVSALEVDRYTVEPDGLLIRASAPPEPAPTPAAATATAGAGLALALASTTSLLPPRAPKPSTGHAFDFSLDLDEELVPAPRPFKLFVQPSPSPDDAAGAATGVSMSATVPGAAARGLGSALTTGAPSPQTTAAQPPTTSSGLQHSQHPPDVLPLSVLELLTSQAKFISGSQHKPLIDNTAKLVVQGAATVDEFRTFDYGELLWAEADRESGAAGEEEWRGRSRSPPRNSRKVSQSLTSKQRTGQGVDGSAGAGGAGGGTDSDADRDDSREGGAAAGAAEGGAKASASPSASASALTAVTSNSAERRSRSMGKNFRLGPAAGAGGKKGTHRESPARGAGAGAGAGARDAEADPTRARQLAILAAVPPDCLRRFNASKGPVHGVWLVPHPLKLYPAAWADIMNVIQDSNLSDGKKLEWELDVLREYDEKRIDRLEALLVGKRSAAESHARSASVTKCIYYKQSAGKEVRDSLRKAEANGYYRDRGRQPMKTPIPTIHT